MSSLLKQLQARGGGSVHDQVHYRKQFSFLFDDVTARTISLEQFYDIGSRGLQGLIQLDTRFTSYQNTIFKESFMRVDREVASKEYNDAIDESVGIFLSLLSPYFLQTHAHYCLEYLLQVFQIHKYSADKLLRCVLPYHEHVLFSRTIQLIPLQKIPLWSFLEANAQTGLPLSTDTLVEKALINPSILVVASQLLFDSADQSTLSNTIIAFWTKLANQLIAARGMHEAHVRNIFVTVSRGLFHENENWLSSSLLVTMSIANNLAMAESLIEDLIEALCRAVQHHIDLKSRCEHSKDSYNPILVLFSLAYLVVHADSDINFSSGTKTQWWNMISFLTGSSVYGSESIIIKEYFQGNVHASDLFKGAVERMLMSYSFTGSNCIHGLKTLFEAGIIQLLPSVKEDEALLLCTFDCVYRSLRDTWQDNAEGNHLAKTVLIDFLCFFQHNFFQFFEQHVQRLREEENDREFFDNFFLTALQRPCVQGSSSEDAVQSSAEPSSWALFSTNVLELKGETQADTVLSTLTQQRIIVEKNVQGHLSNSLSSRGLLISKFHEVFLPKLLSWMVQKKLERSTCVQFLLNIWAVVALVNSNASPYLDSYDKASQSRNVCTAVRLVSCLLWYIDETSSKTVSSGKSFFDLFPVRKMARDGSGNMIILRLSGHFSTLFQPVLSFFTADAQKAFNSMHSVDAAVSYYILLYSILQNTEDQASDAMIVEFLSKYAEFDWSKDSRTEKIFELSWKDVIGGSSRHHSYSQIAPDASLAPPTSLDESFLWNFSFFQLLRQSDRILTSGTSAMRLCEIYARGNDSCESLFEYAIRASYSHTCLVDGLFLHQHSRQCFHAIQRRLLSLLFSSNSGITNIDRLLVLYIVGLYTQVYKNKEEKTPINFSMWEVTNGQSCSQDTIALQEFVKYITGLAGVSGYQQVIPDDMAQRHMDVFIRLLEYFQSAFESSLADSQKVVLIHNFYCVVGFIGRIYESNGTVVQFLLKLRPVSSGYQAPSPFPQLKRILTLLTEVISSKLIPTEIMLHRIFTVSFDSREEVAALIQCVSRLAHSKGVQSSQTGFDRYCPREYVGVSVNDIVLTTLHLIFEKQVNTGLLADNSAEQLFKLLLLSRPQSPPIDTCDSSLCDFSWNHLWGSYSTQLLDLCFDGLQYALFESRNGERALKILHTFLLGIPCVPTGEEFRYDHFKKLLSDDLKRKALIVADGATLEAFVRNERDIDLFNRIAELEIAILADFGLEAEELEALAWSFLQSPISSLKMQQLSMRVLFKRWEAGTAESISTKANALMLDLFDTSELAEGSSIFQAFTKYPQYPLQSLNEVMLHLGIFLEHFKVSDIQGNITWMKKLLMMIQSDCFSLPARTVLLLTILAFCHENTGASYLIEVTQRYMLDLSRDVLCEHVASMFQFIDKVSGTFIEDNRDEHPGYTRLRGFADFLLQYFLSLLSSFIQKSDTQSVTSSCEMKASEHRLLLQSSSGILAADAFWDILSQLFSVNELMKTCVSLFTDASITSEVDVEFICRFLHRAFVKPRNSETHVTPELILSCLCVLSEQLRVHYPHESEHQWMVRYGAILGAMHALLSLKKQTLVISSNKMLAEVEILPYFNQYFSALRSSVGHFDSDTHFSKMLDDSLCLLASIFHSLSSEEKIRRINWYSSIAFGPGMRAAIGLSHDVVRTGLSIFEQLFSEFDIVVGALSTQEIYTSILRTLVGCSVKQSEDGDLTPLIQAMLNRSSRKMDVPMLLHAFERICHNWSEEHRESQEKQEITFPLGMRCAIAIINCALRGNLDAFSRVKQNEAENWTVSIRKLFFTSLTIVASSDFYERSHPLFRTSFVREAGSGIVELTLQVIAKITAPIQERFVMKVIQCLEVDEFLAESAFHKESATLPALTRMYIISRLSSQIMRQFPQIGINTFPYYVESLKRVLAVAEQTNWLLNSTATLVVQGIIEGRRLRSNAHLHEHTDLVIELLGETIAYITDSLHQMTETPLGVQVLENSCAENEKSLFALLTQVCCNPMWHSLSFRSGLPMTPSYIVKLLNGTLGDMMSKTVRQLVDSAGEMKVQRAKIIQDFLLQGTDEHILLRSLSDEKVRMKSFYFIRCEIVLIMEAIYKSVGQPMNVLLRDTLSHFSKFMEDTNPAFKSLARKALHSMTEAVGLDVSTVLGAL